MQNDARKAAIAAYKERKVVAGVYKVRCLANGESWIGHAPDLSTIQNRLWFTLRQGSHRERALQAAWRTHGEAQFAFEEVERIDAEELAIGHERVMKARLAHWARQLNARPL